jgi:hypothetical protein
MAQRRRWEDLATTTSKRLLGSGGQGGDNDGDVDPRGDDYNDTTISLAMAMATRVAGDKECNDGKSDGDDKKGCGQATATAPKSIRSPNIVGRSHSSYLIVLMYT